ncbi:MAG: hypothetical protein E7293_04260 [Lachnospiraceae bacterium]|nr:hypothetical protein [Lachnospiraceae bacterium]
MKKKKAIIIISLIIVVVAIFLLTHIPKRIQCTMTVANAAGETAVLDVDLLYYSNLIFPSYVKGTLSVDGVAYIDEYTMYKTHPYLPDHRLFPSDWWKYKGSLPENTTFIRSDCTDFSSAGTNRVYVLDIVFHDKERACGQKVGLYDT